jgi:hypothetical protein
LQFQQFSFSCLQGFQRRELAFRSVRAENIAGFLVAIDLSGVLISVFSFVMGIQYLPEGVSGREKLAGIMDSLIDLPEFFLCGMQSVFRMRKFDTEANLFGIHAQISLFKNQINYRPFRLDITIQMCENKANRKINHQI